MKIKRSGQERQNRARAILFRVTPPEYELITTRWHETTCRSFSEYIRKIMFSKPVIVRHRNQSLDDLMGILILLRTELNIIMQNHDQVVKQLSQLRESASIENWLREHEAVWETINQKITEIKIAINNIDDQWLQK